MRHKKWNSEAERKRYERAAKRGEPIGPAPLDPPHEDPEQVRLKLTDDVSDIMRQTIGSLPFECPAVTNLVEEYAWELAYARHYRDLARGAQLGTSLGIQYSRKASQHSARSERVLSTAVDVSRKLYKTKGAKSDELTEWLKGDKS